MDSKCLNCSEKCPQAERVKNAALGRMYATNEFISLQKKVDSGNLVEVVRCKDCQYKRLLKQDDYGSYICMISGLYPKGMNDYCNYGERKE